MGMGFRDLSGPLEISEALESRARVEMQGPGRGRPQECAECHTNMLGSCLHQFL